MCTCYAIHEAIKQSFVHQSQCWVIIIKPWLIPAMRKHFMTTLHEKSAFSLQHSSVKFDVLTKELHKLGCDSSIALPPLHLSALYTAFSANGDHRSHILHLHTYTHTHTILIITTLIVFTAQPTNFQHVQICRLCNPADDLAGSEHPFIKNL